MDIRIRPGNADDLPAVFALVKELAKFEKAPGAVTSAVDDYRRAFDEKLIHIFVADSDTEIVGMALYFDAFSTWKGKMLYLDDLYVRPEYRNKGIGRLLFKKLIDEAKKRSCTMMKWQVLEWNEDAIRFYKRINTVFDREWVDCKVMF